MSSLPPILCVDDNEAHLELFVRTFEAYYDIHPARSALEAIEILRRRGIRLILSDQRMPGMTGVQLFEAIRDEYPDPVRIILTSYTDIAAIIRAINLGQIYRYINKPWDEKELKVILDRALENYGLEMRNRQLKKELELRAVRERKIRKTFQRDVPAVVVNELLDTQYKDAFLGEWRVVAVLYFDIRDFGRISSRLTAAEVMVFLNHYYTVIDQIVGRRSGILKDGKLAVFGAPISALNNAENAVRAAVEMVDAMAKLNRSESAPLGEKIRFSIGDTVNTAARIQELTRDEPGTILLSQSVLDQVGKLVEVDALEPVTLRGRNEISHLYRVVSDDV